MPGTAKKKVTPKRATGARSAKPAKGKSTKRAAKPAKSPRGAKAAAKPAKKAAKKAVAPKAAPRKAAPKKAPAAKPPAKKPAPAKAKAAAKPVASARAVKAAPKKKTVTCELSGFEITPEAPKLSPKTVERLREKLLEEKSHLLKQAEDLAAEAEQLARDREAGDTQFDEESGEGDTVNIERERDLMLSASHRQVVEEIDEALARMKKGAYGVCKYAGRKIPVERLEAIPWANVCVQCADRAQRRR